MSSWVVQSLLVFKRRNTNDCLHLHLGQTATQNKYSETWYELLIRSGRVYYERCLLGSVHTTRVHGPCRRAVNTGSVDEP